jgi:drug/metabolite transporter (DMT)-like permease
VAIILGLASAALFGGLTVMMRIALQRSDAPGLGALVMNGAALVVAVVAALPEVGSWHHVDLGALGWIALAGALAPGLAGVVYTRAVRAAGASRTVVVFGMAPLVAVVIALVALDEPLKGGLIAGTVLIVAGGLAVAFERTRPESFRWIGVLMAAGCMTLFATRDNVTRWKLSGTHLPPTLAVVVSLAAGTAVALAATPHRDPRLLFRRGTLLFVPCGVVFGISYVTLFEAYAHGRVSVVSPIVATETLFGVVLSAVFLRRSELVGPRLLAGAALVVAGSALIGVFR